MTAPPRRALLRTGPSPARRAAPRPLPALPGRAAAMWRALRPGSGGVLRLRAVRDAHAAVRLHVLAAALRSGVLSALEPGAVDVDGLARRAGATDRQLLAAWLRVLQAAGWVRRRGPLWRLSPAGRSALQDDVLDAVQEALTGVHLQLYRGLPDQLAGGPGNGDVAPRGGVVAALLHAGEDVVTAMLDPVVASEAPARVLDVGCGEGGLLAAALRSAPAALGVGAESDPDAARAARRTLAERGVADRGQVFGGGLRDLIGRGELGGGYDVVLMSGVVHDVPLDRRVEVLRDVVSLMSDRGMLLVVTPVPDGSLAAAHLDLLLRSRRGGAALPDVDELGDQMRTAGLVPSPPRRVLPGTPLRVVQAHRT